jgi:putative membrane protein
LSSGSAKLADGLRDGVAALPTMTTAEQQELAQAVAAPVAVESDVAEPADATRLGIAPAVLATLLWLGAALIYLLRPALPPARLEQPGLPWRVALAGWTPALVCAVAQALLLVPVLTAFDISTAHLGVLLAGLVLAGATFAALVQGIVAQLGASRGRATVLVFLALQVLLLNGLLPIDAAPDAVQQLHGLLPVPAAADLVHAGVTGHGTVLSGVLLLVSWGVLGLVLTTRAARRAATVTPADLRTSYDEETAGGRGRVLAAR